MRHNSGNIDVLLFEIERFEKDGPNNPGRWLSYRPVAQDFGETWRYNQDGHLVAPLAYEFSACGAAWQRYGIYGTMDETIAARAFVALMLHRKTEQFRLVARHYQIKTTEICRSSARE